MHDLKTLSADIAALLKMTGDSGDTGDKLKKTNRHGDIAVATCSKLLSPLINRVETGEIASGDDKADSKQSLSGGVASVATVASHFQQGRAPTLAPGNVAEWHAILDELTTLDLPEWASPVRWQNMISDASAFLARWAVAAEQLRWTMLDLFGVHPAAPADRYDVMGLLLVIQGGDVVAITPNAAVIRRPSQSILTYRRRNAAGGVLVTEAS